MIKVGARVVLLDDNGAPKPGLGTVKDTMPSRSLALVEWDNVWRIERMENLISHQQLKAMFKHGPKLNKRGQRV